VSEVEFYNKIYSDNPLVWDAPQRDAQAYIALSRHIDKPDTLLDIGCGNGHTIRYLMYFWKDTAYCGIDYSDEAIRVAKYRVPEADFYCTSFEEFPEELFDVVTVMGVAEHFYDLPLFFSRLRKFSKLAYIECPNCLATSDSCEEGYRRGGSDQMEWHLRKETWEGIIKDAGWQITDSIKGEIPAVEFIWVMK
jgi:SAM-dependent methyltransferase